MEFLSPAALIGAALGFVLGLVDYKIVAGVLEGRLRKLDRSQGPAEKAQFETRIVWMRRLLFISTVGFFPVVGYFTGLYLVG